MIGLEKGTVQVIPHYASWRVALKEQRRVLHELLRGHMLDIQRVGSTAVPGIDAKPIIDIAVAVASTAEVAQCRQPLCDLGYIDRGDSGTEGGYLFVKESAPEVRTHHLHMGHQEIPNHATAVEALEADTAGEALNADD